MLHKNGSEINEYLVPAETAFWIVHIDKSECFFEYGKEGVQSESYNIEPFQCNNKQEPMNSERDEVCVTP